MDPVGGQGRIGGRRFGRLRAVQQRDEIGGRQTGTTSHRRPDLDARIGDQPSDEVRRDLGVTGDQTPDHRIGVIGKGVEARDRELRKLAERPSSAPVVLQDAAQQQGRRRLRMASGQDDPDPEVGVIREFGDQVRRKFPVAGGPAA